MDKADAKNEILKIMSKYKKKSYKYFEDLTEKEPIVFEFTNRKGNWYQVKIESFLDGKEGRIRVLFSIDDGGIRAFFPTMILLSLNIEIYRRI